MPLRDVFLDARWSEAVDASPMAAYYLSAMTYDEFVHQPKARMLSYRADRVTRFDCAVRDPARVVSDAARAFVPLGCLETPQIKSGWTHLWIDALHHLDEPGAKRDATRLSAWLCLNVTVLPQAWLTQDLDASRRRVRRAWMNRELAFGRVDRDALDLFFEMCVREHAEQTGGKIWDGADADLRGPRLLARLIGRRPRAAASEEASDPDVPIAALEWWSRINSLTTERRSSVVRRASVDRKAPSPGGVLLADSGRRRRRRRPHRDGRLREDTDGECELQLKELMYNLSARQLSDDPVTNRAALEKDVALAWHVVCAYASDAFYEPTDAYVCSTSAAPPGRVRVPNVRDPLDSWKRKYASKNEGPPKGRDGKLAYRAEDVDVDALDGNHEILRVCWRTLAPRKDWDGVPELLRGVVHADHARRLVVAAAGDGEPRFGAGARVAHDARGRGAGGALLRLRLLARAQRAQEGGASCAAARARRARSRRAARTTARTPTRFRTSSATARASPRTYAGEVLRILTDRLEHSGAGGGNL